MSSIMEEEWEDGEKLWEDNCPRNRYGWRCWQLHIGTMTNSMKNHPRKRLKVTKSKVGPTGQTLMGFDSFAQISLVVETQSF